MDEEVREFLFKHLQGIMTNDIASYHETTSEDLTLYEWWVTPHRLDGLPFHEFMMNSNAERGAVFGAEQAGKTRFDLSNLLIQRYGDTAIASYTLLVSTAQASGVKVAAHNESRVMVKMSGKLALSRRAEPVEAGVEGWKVVHVHKSPAYSVPHTG